MTAILIDNTTAAAVRARVLRVVSNTEARCAAHIAEIERQAAHARARLQSMLDECHLAARNFDTMLAALSDEAPCPAPILALVEQYESATRGE